MMEKYDFMYILFFQYVNVVEDAIAPYECGDNEVLVNVKAASVHLVDLQICNGYGRTLRSILQKIYKVNFQLVLLRKLTVSPSQCLFTLLLISKKLIFVTGQVPMSTCLSQ